MKLFFLTPGFAIVIPAQAGIQCTPATLLDSRLCGNDGGGAQVSCNAGGAQRHRSLK